MLAHPLPAGMRDLLPGEAARRRALADRVLAHVALHGYELVTPPAFELAEVLERGLGPLSGGDVLRFVEPESGEVAALRPDMTPQIARMVATRLAAVPDGALPVRLAYEGAVVRRRQGPARKHRQIAQAGVELCGPSRGGDLEILSLCASVARALDLDEVVIDIGHAGIPRALLGPLPAELAAEVSEALGHKDASRVARLLEGREHGSLLATLCDLHGGGPGDVAGETLLARGKALLDGTHAAAALADLTSLWLGATREASSLVNLPPLLRLDLGAARGFAYYTGLTFQVLARGPGEPVGAGGRYDDLLARFDAPMPAVGFALNLDSVAWAREALGVREALPTRVLVLDAAGADGLALAAASALRARGIPAVIHDGRDLESARAYAAATRFTHLVEAAPEGLRVVPYVVNCAPSVVSVIDVIHGLDELTTALTDSPA